MASSIVSAPAILSARIRDWLVDERYLDPTLEHTITDAGPDARRVVFRISPGRRFERVELAFPGARGIEPTELEDVIKDQKLGPKVFTAPGTVTDLLQRVYREQGYLAAEIDPPQYDFSGPRARAVYRGPRGPAVHDPQRERLGQSHLGDE